MESEKGEIEEQEVTVEVLPQTVTEIIYLQDSDLCYTTGEDSDIRTTESYEIGSVDLTKLASKSLVLDASQSFVLLSSGTDLINGNALYLSDGELNQNYLEHTEEINSGIGEFICTLCNYKCRSLSSLSAHRLIHDDQFIRCHYNCVVCGLQFDKAHTRSQYDYSLGICLSHNRFNNKEKPPGRPRTARTPENVRRLRQAIACRSALKRAAAFQLSERNMRQILHQDLKFQPHNIALVHAIHEYDFGRREC
ncbi:hypothetical protein Trydic_g16378 [Trypoxylus dichotomus]